MKKSLFLLISLGITTILNAQNTLEFNQAILVGSTVQTVPAGKVWKVESVMANTPRKAFSPYFIKVNGKNIYFSDYSYSGKGWMDVAQIQIYYKQNQTCSSTPNIIFKYHGFESKAPFWGRTSSGVVQNLSSWHLVSTISPQTPGNPLYITNVLLYIDYWEAADVRLDITYTNGSTQSMTIPGYQSSVCQSGTWQFISTTPGGTSGTYAEVPESEMYMPDTQLPLWLPENTTLQTGDNVEYINVIEFNIIP